MVLMSQTNFVYAQEKNIRISLVEAPKQEDGKYVVILRTELDEGWHTYYKEPGDTGLPPRFEWDKSVNAKDFDILQWPDPWVMSEAGFTIKGYEGTFDLLFVYTVADPSSPRTVNLTAYMMICNEICIPETLQATLEIIPDKP